ncbi:MAG: cation:proton antiporter [Deltaproteobacteria bacterium]|nr:cation:proton antiporter [Deltaproteobacteria bacterium]
MVAIAAAMALVFARLKLPAVIGYLIAGMIIGPYTPPFQLVKDLSIIEFSATLGIIFLLFSIGLNFDMQKLRQVGLFLIVACAIEVTIMMTLGYATGRALGWGQIESIFLGAVLVDSSTAVMSKVFMERAKAKEHYVDVATGLTIMEDFAAIILLTMLTPLGTGGLPELSILGETVAKIGIFVVVTFILGFAIIPRILNYAHKSANEETVLLLALTFCFALALLSIELGLSVAIGAFITGVVVARARPVATIRRHVDPLRELFLAIFFVSIGMMIDLGTLGGSLALAGLIALVFVVGKLISVSLATYLCNIKIKTAFMTGMAMVAMSEFSFVIAKFGVDAGAVPQSFYTVVLGAALITILVMPVSSKYSPQMFERIVRSAPAWLRRLYERVEKFRQKLRLRLSSSVEAREQVRRDLFHIVADIAFIETIILGARVMYWVKDLFFLTGTLDLLISSAIMLLASVLVMPLVFNLVNRLNIILAVMTGQSVDGVADSSRRRRLAERGLGSITTALLVFVLMLFLVSSSHMTESLSLLTIVVIVSTALVIAHLVWEALQSAYKKMTEAVEKTLVDVDDEEDTH